MSLAQTQADKRTRSAAIDERLLIFPRLTPTHLTLLRHPLLIEFLPFLTDNRNTCLQTRTTRYFLIVSRATFLLLVDESCRDDPNPALCRAIAVKRYAMLFESSGPTHPRINSQT